MRRAAALKAFHGQLRHGQLIELYHATVRMPAPLRPKCAAFLATHGLLHRWGDPPKYMITRKGWLELRRNWHRIADKVHGYPKARA